MTGKRISLTPLKKSAPKRLKPQEVIEKVSVSLPSTSTAVETRALVSSPTHSYTPQDVITPDEWSDSSLEQSLIQLVDKVEKDEREKLERMIANEKHRLIHETVYPITRSGSKFVSIGVKPLEDYRPVLKIHNPELTSAAIFSMDTFTEFVQDMRKVLECGSESVLEGQIFAVLPTLPSVYKSLFLSVETIRVLTKMGDHLLNVLQGRKIQYKSYPCYSGFINNVDLEMLSKNPSNFNETLFDVIKDRYDDNGVLYEIILKMPVNVKTDVNARVAYYRHHNDYNCL
nr:PREDICTED: uncharacterized protein LOC100141879 isoform X2 [Tribolium castaneum]|eukprot:XP_015840323.1 PREDICTED: uncharacterized protein LOC100141879 isoform X2 [Tribolium castaneum]